MNAILSWLQIYIFSFEYQLLSSWFALFVARFYGARVDLLNRIWELSEAHLGTDWSAPLDSTSCRRLVIETASARRCDNERSPCKRWGLAISVKSKEKFSLTNGKIGFRRTKASVESKDWLAFAELYLQPFVYAELKGLSLPDARDSFSNHVDICVFPPPLWDNLTFCHQKLAEMICNTK